MDLVNEVTKLVGENEKLQGRLHNVRKWAESITIALHTETKQTNGTPTETVKAKPGHKAAFTAAQIEHIRDARKAGTSAKSLAKSHGVSLVTIYKYTKGHK